MSNLDKIKSEMTAHELLGIAGEKFPWLVDGLIPRYGIGAIVGESEVGKSSLLRQLAIDTALGRKKFLDFKLNTKNKRAIYVSTEDEQMATSQWLSKHFRINKTQLNTVESSLSNNLKKIDFLFDASGLLDKLEEKLEKQSYDLIIIDAFSDTYPHSMNAVNEVRMHLEEYSKLAKKYHTFFLFLHHFNKSSSGTHKNRITGSQGFEGKMRVVFSLSGSGNSVKLEIIKHNYLSTEGKKVIHHLQMNDQLTFEVTGSKDIKQAKKQISKNKKQLFIEKFPDLIKLYSEGDLSSKETISKAKEKGFEISGGTLTNTKKLYLKRNK